VQIKLLMILSVISLLFQNQVNAQENIDINNNFKLQCELIVPKIKGSVTYVDWNAEKESVTIRSEYIDDFDDRLDAEHFKVVKTLSYHSKLRKLNHVTFWQSPDAKEALCDRDWKITTKVVSFTFDYFEGSQFENSRDPYVMVTLASFELKNEVIMKPEKKVLFCEL